MKKITSKIFKISTIFSIILMLQGCIDDNITPPLTGKLNSTAELLIYFETLGDFANSHLAPALVDAEEVYANIGNYLIIDVRNSSDFTAGHIEEAVNVASDSLYNYMISINNQNYQKIVLVSKNGHASAYYSCLLRLSGFDNVYTLNFGMASWHLDFANEWLNSVADDQETMYFTNDNFPKNDFTDLPVLNFQTPNASIEGRVNERITLLLNIGFKRLEVYHESFLFYGDDLLICYGTSVLYNRREIGHKTGTIHYMSSPLYDLRSVNYLQTLPTNKSIIIYSFNGQLSACITAYLRVLGYDARTLQFGANQIFYSKMLIDPILSVYAFDQTDIRNFNYVRGN